MSVRLQVKRRINGAAGSPSAAQGVAGELSINFPGAAGSTTKPVLFAHDGTTWRTVNPDVTVTTQSINLGSTAANIGAGYTAWAAIPGNTVTGNVVIATFGSPAAAYVLTGGLAAAGTSAAWTSLGGAVQFALSTDVITGTDTVGALNSAVLAGAAVNGATTPVAGDNGKYVRVGANGKIAAALLPSDSVNMKGSIAATAAAPTTPTKGDSYFLNLGGVFPASWTGIATQTGKVGDRVIYDGAAWHLIPNGTDLNAYLALAGGNMADTAVVTFPVPAAAGLVTRINGSDPAKSALDGFTIDCSTY